MDYEIDLRDILLVLWKNRLLIVGIFLVAVVAAGAISYAIPSVYRVSSIVSVGNFGDPVYTTQASAKEIMQSDTFMSNLIEQLNYSLSPGELRAFKDSIKFEPVQGSDRLLLISVETKNPREGKEIVEEMVWLFINQSEKSYSEQEKYVSDKLASTVFRLATVETDINQTREVLENLQKAVGPSQPGNELSISQTLNLLNVEESRRSGLMDSYLELQYQLNNLKSMEFVQPAREPFNPIQTSRTLIVAVAGMLGLMIGIFAAFLREWLRSGQNDHAGR